MAEVFLRKSLPPSRVGQVPSRDLPPLEADPTLSIVADFAGDVWDGILETRIANDKASFQTSVNLAIASAETEIAKNPGMSIEDMKKIQDTMISEIDATGNNFTLPASKNFARRFKDRNLPLIKQKLQTGAAELAVERALIDLDTNIKDAVAAKDVPRLIQLLDGAEGMLSEEMRDAKLVQGANQIIAIDEADRAAQAKIEAEANLGAAMEDAFNAWTATVTPENPDGDLSVVFNSIAQDERVPAQDKQEAETEVKARIINRRAEANLALEAQQEEDLGKINEILYINKNYTAADIAIKESSLSNSDKGKLFSDSSRRATAAAKGVPLSNDRVEEARLYEKSLDIWRGTTTKKEFDADLLVNSKKLDDDAYKRVSQSAANTLKSSQAESLSRANREASRQLVDFSEDNVFAKFISDSIKGLEPDAAKLFEQNANEERQLQFWSLSRYNAEMRQWIEDNPDKTGKEFFQTSEALLHTYWNQSIEELKVLRAERVAEVEDQTRADGTRKSKGFLGELNLPDGNVATEYSVGIELNGKETEIPTLVPTLTQDEVNQMTNNIIPNNEKIPDAIMNKAISHAKKRIGEGKSPFKEKGESAKVKSIIMFSPDGKRFTVPIEKKQLFIDNGYAE